MTNAAPPAAPDVLKLSSPTDVVIAVPYLLGFQPAESLVLLSLRGARRRVGLTLRVDLPRPADAAGIVAELIPHLRRDGAKSAIAVLYAAEADAAEALWLVLRSALDRQRIATREALRVAEGRWWSYVCSDPQCCPAAGTVIPDPAEPGGPTRVAAHLVGTGLAVLGSRRELEDSVRAADSPALQAMTSVLDSAARDVVRRVVQPGGLAACRREWQRSVVQTLQQRSRQHPPAQMTQRQVAELLIALADVPTRDVAADWVTGRGQATAESAQSLWHELTRRAPAPYDVAPAALLALAAWHAGHGALARVAVDRALTSDPSYRLARLVERLLDGGVDPAKARRQRYRAGRR
jgi:Domain of unknown function (DUF4192)